MRTIATAAALLLLSGLAGSASATNTFADSTVLNLSNSRKMVMYGRTAADLSAFQKYNIDSVLAKLNGYSNDTYTSTTRFTRNGKTVYVYPLGTSKNQALQNVKAEVAVSSTTAAAGASADAGTPGYERAMHSYEKAMKEYEQAMEEMERNMEKLENSNDPAKKARMEAFNLQMKELDKQMAQLDKQMEEMDKQMEQLGDGEGKKRERVTISIGSSDKGTHININSEGGPAAPATPKTPAPPARFNSEMILEVGLNAVNWEKEITSQDNGKVVELQPFGSRYFGIGLTKDARIGGEKSPLHLEGALLFSFNNLMFDNNLRIENQHSQTVWRDTTFNLSKSKLAVASLNVPVMAKLQFKSKSGKESFRIGAGGFAGYRLSSHSKLKYTLEGDTKKTKDKGSYNLEDFQYGVQGLIGFRSTDLFFRYNLSEYWRENRGPQANLMTFGVAFRL